MSDEGLIEEKDSVDCRDYLDQWETSLAVELLTDSTWKEVLASCSCTICNAGLGSAVPLERDSQIECYFCGTPYAISFPDGTIDSFVLRSPYYDDALREKIREIWRRSARKAEFQEAALKYFADWQKAHHQVRVESVDSREPGERRTKK
jgi:hypothetical protein